MHKFTKSRLFHAVIVGLLLGVLIANTVWIPAYSIALSQAHGAKVIVQKTYRR